MRHSRMPGLAKDVPESARISRNPCIICQFQRRKLVAETTLGGIIDRHEHDLLNDWMRWQLESLERRRDLISEPELRTDSRNLLSVLKEALAAGAGHDIAAPEWAKARDLLMDLSRRRAMQGFSPSETATFVF